MKKGDLVLVLWTHDQKHPPHAYGVVSEILNDNFSDVLLGGSVVTLHNESLMIANEDSEDVHI